MTLSSDRGGGGGGGGLGPGACAGNFRRKTPTGMAYRYGGRVTEFVSLLGGKAFQLFCLMNGKMLRLTYRLPLLAFTLTVLRS